MIVSFLRFSALSVLILCLCWVSNAHAQIYKWTDKEGKTHYSQTPPTDKGTEAENIADDISMSAGKSTDTTANKTKEGTKKSDGSLAAARQAGEENKVKHKTFCDQQQAALKQLLANPVIRWKSKKEEKILSAKERKQKISEFEKNIKEMCNAAVLEKNKVSNQ